jgi:hypothetical protein
MGIPMVEEAMGIPISRLKNPLVTTTGIAVATAIHIHMVIPMAAQVMAILMEMQICKV